MEAMGDVVGIINDAVFESESPEGKAAYGTEGVARKEAGQPSWGDCWMMLKTFFIAVLIVVRV